MSLTFVPLGASGSLPAVRTAVPGKACVSQHASQGPQNYGLKPSTFAGLLGASAVGAAFSRSTNGHKHASAVRAFDPSTQQGVTEPFGFFDPLGFAKGKDEAEFRKLRVAELKHGRVAMMASLGLVLPHYFKAPGFAEVPCGIGAISTELGGAGFAGLFLGAGLHELVLWKDDESKDPGDFGDPFKFGESIVVDRNYEINNGRMAMFAVVGQLVAELATGKDAVQQLGFA